MREEKKSSLTNYLILGLVAALISMFTYQANGQAIEFNIDPSWHFALNYFFLHHIQFGRDVHFTYGPLGFLAFALPLGANLLIAAWFWFIARFILIFSTYKLLLNIHHSLSTTHTLLLAISSIIFFSLLNVYLLFFLTIVFILLFTIQQKIRYLIFASLVTVITFLIKPGWGLFNFLALNSYLFLFSIYYKSLKKWLFISIITVVFYLGIWFSLYQNFSGCLNFLYSSWQFIFGFNQAMSIVQANSPTYILFSLIFFILSGFAFSKRPIFSANGSIVYLIMILPVLVCYKFSFTREDQHVYLILSLLVMSYSFWLLLLNSLKACLVLLACGLTAIYFIYANQIAIGYLAFPLHPIFGFNRFYQEIIHAQQYKDNLMEKSQKNFSLVDLPIENQLDIANNTFDIYPFDLSIIAAKNLSWQPHPVSQSYTTYTAYLDNLNARHFNSNAGADYLIWHNADNLTELDNRYLFNSEPNTIFAIFNHYQPILSHNTFVILKKRPLALYDSLHNFKQQIITWNQWTAVPNTSYNIVRSQIFLQQSLSQKLLNIFRKTKIMLDYKLANNEIISYPLIIDTAKNGIWIKPLPRALTDSIPRIDINIYPHLPLDKINYRLDKSEFNNGFLLLSGWAFVEKFNLADLGINLILSNNKQGFIFKSERQTRADAIAKFPGLALNPEYSGFKAKLNIAGLAKDNYDLYLQLTYQKKLVIFGPIASFKIGDQQLAHSEIVQAIRLRQEGDNYSKEIYVEWIGGNFINH